jgi:hypothetical protein
MIATAIARLDHLCQTIPPLLTAIEAADFIAQPAADKWSKQQIIGHLIDSATNNHQRFVRAQFEQRPTIAYDQNNWNHCSYHQQLPTQQLIDFWAAYNRHLLLLIRQIPAELLQRECIGGDGQPHSLAFFINDYVAHLEHHLRQVVAYD